MINSILRKHKYRQTIQRRALSKGYMWKMVCKHFSDLCKPHLKKMRKAR